MCQVNGRLHVLRSTDLREQMANALALRKGHFAAEFPLLGKQHIGKFNCFGQNITHAKLNPLIQIFQAQLQPDNRRPICNPMQTTE
jgi:hypothetical protein